MEQKNFNEDDIRAIIEKRQLQALFKKNTKALSILIKALLRAEKSYPKQTLQKQENTVKPLIDKKLNDGYNKVMEAHSSEGLKRGVETVVKEKAILTPTKNPTNPLIRADQKNTLKSQPQTPLNLEG